MHASHGLKRRFWSKDKMQAMLATAKIKVPVWARVGELNDDDWNELGDWLYYQCHPKEIDSMADRPRPYQIIGRITGKNCFFSPKEKAMTDPNEPVTPIVPQPNEPAEDTVADPAPPAA